MAYGSPQSRLARNHDLWPLLLLLVLVVVVPTACVLWFMTEAMQNERLAVRQKLMAVYQGQLAGATQQFKAYLDDKKSALTSIDTETPAAEIFARLVRTGVADSAIVYDGSGESIYPTTTKPGSGEPPSESAEWHQARDLEFESADYIGAGEAYASIARKNADVSIRARALQAQARCLLKSGEREAALQLLVNDLNQDDYRDALDAQGRLIAPSAQLLAVQLMNDPDDIRFVRTLQALEARLVDYTDSTLSADQRRFLMKQLQALWPDEVDFPTLAAEQLAARFLESDLQRPSASFLRRSELPEIWHVTSPDRRVLALYRQSDLMADMQAAIATSELASDLSVELVPPRAEPTRTSLLLSPPGRTGLDGWRLSLHSQDAQDEILSNAAADEQIAAYLWTGMLVVAVIVVVAVLGAGAIQRQVRITRLKNDLVATVSHELKTPLSSMRLLVDTLLDDERFDEQKVHEYLQLIAKENARLTHLIDNFLTFSRMQRNKRAFNMAEIEAAEIANTAVEAAGEKFNAARCRLDLEIAPSLPRIVADRGALVTVVMNLLDNAYKYTEDEKRIALRTYANGGNVCFEVRDNGIGLSRRAAKRVFERFYQADQRLSRAGSGCGLGLSIVQFIVAAHGGSVSVDSEPGQGSTFTVKIPVAAPGSTRTAG